MRRPLLCKIHAIKKVQCFIPTTKAWAVMLPIRALIPPARKLVCAAPFSHWGIRDDPARSILPYAPPQMILRVPPEGKRQPPSPYKDGMAPGKETFKWFFFNGKCMQPTWNWIVTYLVGDSPCLEKCGLEILLKVVLFNINISGWILILCSTSKSSFCLQKENYVSGRNF